MPINQPYAHSLISTRKFDSIIISKRVDSHPVGPSRQMNLFGYSSGLQCSFLDYHPLKLFFLKELSTIRRLFLNLFYPLLNLLGRTTCNSLNPFISAPIETLYNCKILLSTIGILVYYL